MMWEDKLSLPLDTKTELDWKRGVSRGLPVLGNAPSSHGFFASEL